MLVDVRLTMMWLLLSVQLRETRPLSSSSFRGSSRGSQGSELDSAELTASVAMAVQNENAGHMSSRCAHTLTA